MINLWNWENFRTVRTWIIYPSHGRRTLICPVPIQKKKNSGKAQKNSRGASTPRTGLLAIRSLVSISGFFCFKLRLPAISAVTNTGPSWKKIYQLSLLLYTGCVRNVRIFIKNCALRTRAVLTTQTSSSFCVRSHKSHDHFYRDKKERTVLSWNPIRTKARRYNDLSAPIR